MSDEQKEPDVYHSPFNQDGLYTTNQDRLPDPGGFSPEERSLYAETLTCLSKPIDLAVLRELFVLLTQSHWTNSENFGPHAKDLACLTFNRKEDSPLKIRLDSDFSEDEAFSNASIFVNVDRMQFKSPTVDSQAGFSGDLSAVYRSYMVQTIITAAHYNPASDVAYKMADNTMFFYLGIRDSLMGRYNLKAYDPVGVGPLQTINKAPDRCYRVDAQIMLTYTFDVTTAIEGHRLKKFSVAITPIPNNS